MKTKVSKIAKSYRKQGYEPYFQKIDSEIVADFPCDKCSARMRYIGLKKGVSYIAISHCDNCGNEYVF